MKDHAKHNLVIVLLVLAFGVAVIFNLIFLRIYKTQQQTIEKTSSKLYAEQLKRDYFEWRDSTASGHTTDKKNFPREAELEALKAKNDQSD